MSVNREIKLTIGVSKQTIEALLSLRHSQEAEEMREMLGCITDIDISRCDFYKKVMDKDLNTSSAITWLTLKALDELYKQKHK